MLSAIAAAVLLGGCVCSGEHGARTGDQSAAAAAEVAEASADEEPSVLTGRVSREEIEAAEPDWVAAEVAAEIDAGAAAALAAVPPGATVDVFLGTWCSDSRREVPRLWRALDEAEGRTGGEMPFTIRYVAVDRSKGEPADLVAGRGIELVPTFIVRRDGAEVGRIVESSPHGVEEDLRALLTGEAAGVLTASEDGG